MLNLRAAQHQTKVSAGPFLNVAWMVNYAADQAMRDPCQISLRTPLPEIRSEALFKLPVDVSFFEFFT